MEFKSAKNTIWVPHPGSQVHFLRCPADEALLHGNRGGGKAQPLDSMVLTPRGFRRMGDLEVGNKVCNPDGTISTIIGVYPQGKKKVYKVIFHDGSVVRCCGEHLWFGKIIIANTPIEHISNFSEEEFKGINFPSATIQSTININRFYRFIEVGKKFNSKIKTLPIASSQYAIELAKKRIIKIRFFLYKSSGFYLNNEFIASSYFDVDSFDKAAVVRTGVFDYYMLGWNSLTQFTVNNDDPFGFNVLKFETHLDVSE